MYPLAITTSDRDIPATHRTSIHPWRSHQPGQLGPQDGPSQSWVPCAYREGVVFVQVALRIETTWLGRDSHRVERGDVA